MALMELKLSYAYHANHDDYHWSAWELLRYNVTLIRPAVPDNWFMHPWWLAAKAGAANPVVAWSSNIVLTQLIQLRQTQQGDDQYNQIMHRKHESILDKFTCSCLTLIEAARLEALRDLAIAPVTRWTRSAREEVAGLDSRSYTALQSCVREVELVAYRAHPDPLTLHRAAIKAFVGSEQLPASVKDAALAALLAGAWQAACDMIQTDAASRLIRPGYIQTNPQ